MLAGEISEENSRGVPFQWGREGDPPEPGEQGAVRLLAGGLELERQGALCHPGGRRGGVGSLVQSCCQHVAGPSQYQLVRVGQFVYYRSTAGGNMLEVWASRTRSSVSPLRMKGTTSQRLSGLWRPAITE